RAAAPIRSRPTVVITGASGGLGQAMARAWGRCGAAVVLAARDEEGLQHAAREVESSGGRAIVHRADVTREDERGRLIERAKAETGRLDVLVNNAARGHYGSIARVASADLEALFALNVI